MIRAESVFLDRGISSNISYIIYIMQLEERSMKRTTIFIDESLMEEIKAISEEEGKTTSESIREAMKNYVRSKRRKKRRLSFVGVGSSGKRTVASRHEELLWQEGKR